MKSNRSIKLVKATFLGLLAAFLFAGSLQAQSAFRGSFTLPVETRWGRAVLPAGDYELTLPSVGLPATVTVRGEGKAAAMIMAAAYDEGPSSSRSALTLVRHGHKGTVRSLHLAELGLTFYYNPPKGEPQVFAQAPELIQRVPVLRAAKEP